MNEYNSRLDTTVGMDAYNLPFPVVPPAALVIATDDFSPRYLSLRQSGGSGHRGDVVLFNRRDQMLLRSVCVDCNFADGLVDNTALHGILGGMNIQTELDRFMTMGTGTIAIAAGGTAVTGTGTLFLSEYCVGQTVVWIDNGGNWVITTITAITTDLAMTVTAIPNTGMTLAIATTAGKMFAMVIAVSDSVTIGIACLTVSYPVSYFQGDYSKIRPTRGTVTIPAATAGGPSVTMVGKGTLFTRDLVAGQFFRYRGNAGLWICVNITAIVDDTHATIATPAAGTAGVALGLTDGYPGIIALTGGSIPSPDLELKGISGWQDAYLGVRAKVPGLGGAYSYSTINVNPAYQAAAVRLAFNYVVEVEHTFPASSQGRMFT